MSNYKKTIAITGSSDGIGAAAARKLKALGHNVIIIGRNAEKTQKIAKELEAPYHIADFAKLQDVVRLARELSTYPKIDVLCNNAGALFNKRTITEDGFEKTFQVNVLSPFLLTNLLAEKLCSSGATVMFTASIAANMFGQKLSVNNLQNEKNFSAIKAYGESKLCDILLAKELQNRYGKKGINAVAFEPGVPRTNFACDGTRFINIAYHTPIKYLFTSTPEKSAKRMVELALSNSTDFILGETYSKNKLYKVKFEDSATNAQKLWDNCRCFTEKYMQ